LLKIKVFLLFENFNFPSTFCFTFRSTFRSNKIYHLCVLYKSLFYFYSRIDFEYTDANYVTQCEVLAAHNYACASHNRFDALDALNTYSSPHARTSHKLIIYTCIFYDVYNCYSNRHIFHSNIFINNYFSIVIF
jgi:hypothetical protein